MDTGREVSQRPETRIIDGQIFIVKELKPVKKKRIGIGKVHVAEGTGIARERK